VKEPETVWECPDLVYLTSSEDPTITRWLLIVNVNPGGFQAGSGAKYFIGTFNGNTFIPDDPTRMTDFIDYGADFYAVTSYFQPGGEKNGTFGVEVMTWMSNWIYTQKGTVPRPTFPWRGQMAFPRDYGLKVYKTRGSS